MKGVMKWFILSILAMTLFLIPFRVCQGEDLALKKYQGEAIPIQGHTQTPGPQDSSQLLAGKQDHGENPLAQNGPKEIPKDEYALSFGLFVHHYTSEAANEGFENRLIAFEYRNVVISYFDNSYNEDTVFLGYAFHTDKLHHRDYKNWWLRGNFYLGALVGYGDKNPCNYHGVGLGAYPTFSIGYSQTSLETGVMPTFVWWALKYEF